MRPRSLVAAAGALALIATFGACQKTEGSGGGKDETKKTEGVIATDPKDSMGPAPEVPGARKGGTLRILRENDHEHMDPQRNYTLSATAFGHLLYRTLTVFKEQGNKIVLVGDLAEGPGTDVNKDCKVWEFKLKKGVKYEDGREVKAGDVAYGVARSFEEKLADGAVYIQNWLADSGQYRDFYKGPSSGSDKVPGLDVVDDYTLRFNFKSPHCDMPFAASMNTTSPVPKDKDTGEKYDDRPFSLGPYKVKEHKKDQSWTLERNPNWDPNTDPLRHAYPDEVFVEIGPNQTQATERAQASSGDNAFAVAEDGVPAELAPNIMTMTDKDRVNNDLTSLVWRLEVNNDRVKDVKVRRAIAYALDRQAILNIFGGKAGGELTHTVLPPQTIGYKEYPNPYPAPPGGDPERAKQELGGMKPKLVMLSRNVDDPFLKVAQAVKQSLEKAGFQVTVVPVERPKHNPTVKQKGNQYDLYLNGWQPDWPSAASTLPVLYDGSTINPGGGNDNSSYLNVPEINNEIKRIGGLTPDAAAPQWLALDEKIRKDHCPSVPLFVARNLAMNGTKVGGVFNSVAIGTQVYYNAYLKA